MESTPSIPYGNNSQDSTNHGGHQRVIQSEWLDEDHFIVFYTNDARYPDDFSTGSNPPRGVRYKVVHLIDDYMANVVGYGEITSTWFRGRPSEYMMPFKFSDSNKVITSDAFRHLVSIWVPNSNPTVTNDTYTMVEDSVLTVSDVNLSVLVNDSDLDGDTLTVSTNLVAHPNFGSASINSNGTFTYTPNANFTGTDSFAYRALDGVGGFTDGIIYITVTPVADGPTVVSDVYTVAEDQTLTFSDINLGVLANDFDVDGDSLTIDTTPVNPPQNGSLTLNSDGTFHYTPNANFNGTDSFEYKVEDGTGNAESGTVTINVTSVNDSPVAVVDSFTMNEDETLTTSVSLLANDSDLEGDSLTVNTTPVVDVVNGTLTLNADGTFTYAPPANHYGSELFTYEVSDGNGGTAQASVTITIYAVNDTPIPVSDSYSVDENSSIDVSLSLGLIANDTDMDGDTLTVDTTPVVDVSNGTLVLSSDGTFTYTPYANYYGSDSFTYRVTDGNGGVATTTVNITIAEVPNQAPVVAGIDSTYTLTQGQDTVITATATDVDGDAVTWSYEEVMSSGSNYVIVGARYDDDNGSTSGAVYVYDANDLSAQPTKLTAFDGATGDVFGGSVATVADKIVVSAQKDDDNGSIYVYDANDLSAQPTKLTAFDGAADDYFGHSVATVSDKIVVGAQGDDDNGSISGSVYVFDANDLSAQPTKLTAFDGAANDYFGFKVAATSDKIVVGAFSDNDNGSNSGSVYVFDANDLSAQPTKLTAFDGAANDSFGRTISATADKIVVGAYGHDSNSGAVYVFDANDLSAQPTKLSEGEAYDHFGESVAATADKVIVGAPLDDGHGSNDGAVYVYDANDLSAQPTKLTAFDGGGGDMFGQYVFATNDKIFVSAYYGGQEFGSVYVYDANDLSAQPTKLTPSDGVTSGQFGYSIAQITVLSSSLNGTTVTQSDNVFTVTPGTTDADFQLRFTATDSEGNATSTDADFSHTYVAPGPAVRVFVGASRDGDNGSLSGSVYVYDANDLSASPTKLTAFDGAAYDQFGFSVAAGGGKFVVGAKQDDDSGNDAGAVYVYDANDLSTQPTKLTASDGADYDYFGSSVAATSDKVIVGAWGNEENGTNSGAVYVYDANDLSAQPTKLMGFDSPDRINTSSAYDGSDHDWFGYSVAATADKIIVGAGHDDDVESNSGAVYVYDANDLSAQPTKLTAFDGAYNDQFGSSVAAAADKIVVGSRFDDGHGSNDGSVYVYDANDLSAAPTKLTAFDTNANNQFGSSVAAAADKIVVASLGDDDVASNAGAVYVYDANDLSAQPTKLTASDGVENFEFGSALGIASDKLVIGAYKDNASTGAVYVYDTNDLSAQPTKLTAFDGAAGDRFGESVTVG
jgi:VCBS repeat-containing protein